MIERAVDNDGFINPEHQPPYRDVPELVELIDDPHYARCRKLLEDHGDRMRQASGSSRNHQAWEGGYWDHVRDCMNLAVVQYDVDASLRPLPFTRSDALLVLFLHDLEKAWRYEWRSGEKVQNPELRTKDAKREFRERLLAEYGIELTDAQRNAFTYIEGEGDDYTNERRVMGELAAFCHAIDVKSARQWHDHPQPGDPWRGAERILTAAKE